MEMPYGLDVKEETCSHTFQCGLPCESALHSLPTCHSLLPFLSPSSAPSCAQSCLTLCNSMDCTRQAPLSVGFSRKEHWSGLPCPPPGDLPDPAIELVSLMSPAFTGGFFTAGARWEALGTLWCGLKLIFGMPSVGWLEALPCVFVILGP